MLLKCQRTVCRVLEHPVVLFKECSGSRWLYFGVRCWQSSVPAPRPVLNWPSVLLLSETKPTAVLKLPVVRLKSAACPSAVLPPRIAPVRRWDNSLRYVQKPKASEQQRYEEHRRCLFRLNDWIHVVLPFFPRSVRFLDGGSGRGEEPSGADGPPPDSDPFGDASLKKIPLSCQIYSPQLRRNPPCARYGGSGTREIYSCADASTPALDRYAVTLSSCQS